MMRNLKYLTMYLRKIITMKASDFIIILLAIFLISSMVHCSEINNSLSIRYFSYQNNLCENTDLVERFDLMKLENHTKKSYRIFTLADRNCSVALLNFAISYRFIEDDGKYCFDGAGIGESYSSDTVYLNFSDSIILFVGDRIKEEYMLKTYFEVEKYNTNTSEWEHKVLRLDRSGRSSFLTELDSIEYSHAYEVCDTFF